MAKRVLLHDLLSHRDQFYGQEVDLVGYVVWKSDTGAAVYPEFGAEDMIHVPVLWFDWPPTVGEEEMAHFDRKYVVLRGTFQPAPPQPYVKNKANGTANRDDGWYALLDPVTYMLPLSEHSVPAEAGRQARREMERLLREGVICPFCASATTPRLLKSSLCFVCQDCGRSFGAADVVRQ